MNLKKVFAAVLVALQIGSYAMAEDGVFVPSFQSVMDSFYGKLKHINEHYAIDLLESCNKDGAWVEGKSVYLGYQKPEFSVEEGYGFLDTLRIEYSKEYFEKNEEEFKDILYAAISSVLPGNYQLSENDFFEKINYQYVIDSPADSIYIYENFGVYQISFSKSWGKIVANIHLSLYEYD